MDFFRQPNIIIIDIDIDMHCHHNLYIILIRPAPSEVGSRAGYMGANITDIRRWLPPGATNQKGAARSQKEQARVSLNSVVLFWIL